MPHTIADQTWESRPASDTGCDRQNSDVSTLNGAVAEKWIPRMVDIPKLICGMVT